jgi:hypothetical protein
MPANGIVAARAPRVVAPAGTDRPPWLRREPFVAHVARTRFAYDPAIVRGADVVVPQLDPRSTR